MGRPLRILIIAAAAVALVAVLVVAAEMLYRKRLTVSDPRNVQLSYYPHLRFERALVRDTSYGRFVHINRLGFRGYDVEVSKPRNTTRIITVGASTTFDICAGTDAETWPARLEYWLEQLVPGRQFEVLNAGAPGASMLDHIIRLETDYFALDPDIFVVYAGHGVVDEYDAPIREHEQMPNPAMTVPPWDAWMRGHSRLYERFFPRRRPPRPIMTEDQWPAAIETSVATFDRYLTSFTLIAQSMDAEVVMVEINRYTGDKPPTEFDETDSAAWRVFSTPAKYAYESHERYEGVWRNVAEETNSLFVPSDSLNIAGPQYYCGRDVVHFNNVGSDAMGRRLAEQLVQSGVLTR